MSLWRRCVPWAMFMVGLPLFAWQWSLLLEPDSFQSSMVLCLGGLALLLAGFVWLSLRLAHRLQNRVVRR
ncbi:MAG: CHASE1-domain containing sensor protein [Polyangiales bacterium]|jgi:CHASE1-domain containing sensor protein